MFLEPVCPSVQAGFFLAFIFLLFFGHRIPCMYLIFAVADDFYSLCL